MMGGFHLLKPPGKNRHMSSSDRFLLKPTTENTNIHFSKWKLTIPDCPTDCRGFASLAPAYSQTSKEGGYFFPGRPRLSGCTFRCRSRKTRRRRARGWHCVSVSSSWRCLARGSAKADFHRRADRGACGRGRSASNPPSGPPKVLPHFLLGPPKMGPTPPFR